MWLLLMINSLFMIGSLRSKLKFSSVWGEVFYFWSPNHIDAVQTIWRYWQSWYFHCAHFVSFSLKSSKVEILTNGDLQILLAWSTQNYRCVYQMGSLSHWLHRGLNTALSCRGDRNPDYRWRRLPHLQSIFHPLFLLALLVGSCSIY